MKETEAKELMNTKSIEEFRQHLADRQDEVIKRNENSKVLQIRDPDEKGRRSFVMVGKQQLAVRGKRTKYSTATLRHTDWVDPKCIMRSWTFIFPHSAMNKSDTNLWELNYDD